MAIENHPVRLSVWKDAIKGKWEIRVSGVTSGAVIHFGDGDNGTLVFGLDASRFTPVIERG